MTLLNTITPMKFIFSCLVLFLLFSIIQGSSSSSSAWRYHKNSLVGKKVNLGKKPTFLDRIRKITQNAANQMKS